MLYFHLRQRAGLLQCLPSAFTAVRVLLFRVYLPSACFFCLWRLHSLVLSMSPTHSRDSSSGSGRGLLQPPLCRLPGCSSASALPAPTILNKYLNGSGFCCLQLQRRFP